jgi:hypothetical protein
MLIAKALEALPSGDAMVVEPCLTEDALSPNVMRLVVSMSPLPAVPVGCKELDSAHHEPSPSLGPVR